MNSRTPNKPNIRKLKQLWIDWEMKTAQYNKLRNDDPLATDEDIQYAHSEVKKASRRYIETLEREMKDE